MDCSIKPQELTMKVGKPETQVEEAPKTLYLPQSWCGIEKNRVDELIDQILNHEGPIRKTSEEDLYGKIQ